jgi:hypothetical protein
MQLLPTWSCERPLNCLLDLVYQALTGLSDKVSSCRPLISPNTSKTKPTHLFSLSGTSLPIDLWSVHVSNKGTLRLENRRSLTPGVQLHCPRQKIPIIPFTYIGVQLSTMHCVHSLPSAHGITYNVQLVDPCWRSDQHTRHQQSQCKDTHTQSLPLTLRVSSAHSTLTATIPSSISHSRTGRNLF